MAGNGPFKIMNSKIEKKKKKNKKEYLREIREINNMHINIYVTFFFLFPFCNFKFCYAAYN